MEKKIKLTQYSKSAGCAAKLGPMILGEVVGKLPKFQDENLLVGVETSDDGAVYRISEDLAMIQTLDFFPPMVDEPYVFGQAAAANALSDIYAMGGEPRLALNIVAYPNCLGSEVLGEILAGGASKVKEAGAVLAGPGDLLILTKALGVGILNTAVKAEMASLEEKEAARESMTYLNKTAMEVFRQFSIHCCTDVTGFSLAGHSLEIAKASQVSMEIFTEKLPLLPGVLDYAAMGLVPEGTYRNKAYQKEMVFLDPEISEPMEDLLFDPQTSGGLLGAVPFEEGEKLLAALKEAGLKTPAAVIGRVEEKREQFLYFRR